MQQPEAIETARTNRAPIPFECDAPFLKVVGDLPRELNGTLYRNGPNPQFEAPGAHWFVGDGMLHAFQLQNGRASYRNRWIRTPKWQAEHDAGRALFGGFGRRLPGAPASTPRDEGVANTNIIFHAGRLLALEEGHPPTEIEPGTLGRRGYCNYGGGIAGPFTAHPKIDPVTGEMVFFGYNAGGPFTPTLSFGSVDASGAVTRFDRFEAPYASMVHDFIVTENHLLFPVLPITGSMERAMAGRPAYAWEPEKGAYVGVMKRQGSASGIVWFRAENCYVFHVMNAWEEGHRIVADVMQCEEAPLFTHPDGSPTDFEKSRARLCRWTFDLTGNTDRFTQTYLDDIAGASTIAAPVAPAAMAGTPAPTPTCRCSARSPAWSMSTAGERGWPNICCLPAIPSPSRCSWPATARPPRPMAGCWPWSGAPARTAAIWRCSTPPTSHRARWRWCSWGTGFPTDFTATGSGRREAGAAEATTRPPLSRHSRASRAGVHAPRRAHHFILTL